MTIATLIVDLLMRQSPETKRAIQQIEQGFQQLQRDVRQALQRAGFALDDFSDDVSDMARESKEDLAQTGRAADELSRDVTDMARRTDRQLDETEDSFRSLARGAQRSVGLMGAALGAIGGTAALKGAADFRQTIARIDNQLENLSFKQIESGVIRISDQFAVTRDIVAILASQIDTELAPTVEAFKSRLTKLTFGPGQSAP